MLNSLRSLLGSVMIAVTLMIFIFGMILSVVTIPLLVFVKPEKRKTKFMDIMFAPVELFNVIVLNKCRWLFS